MTRFDPQLCIKRLVVKRNDHIAYDEKFHHGVNVIRGANSSGKSTILNLIFYALGGELADWSDVALLCTEVFAEVDINGMPATLRRDITDGSPTAMDIFGGTYIDAIAAPREAWMRYPAGRSQNADSFSQAIFRLLGLPEVSAEASGNVTIHHVLRLLYSDQLSPIESIFRFERFDPPALREAVGRLLVGAYDGSIYSNELTARDRSREFDAVAAELRSLFSVLGQTESAPRLESIAAERKDLERKRAELTRRIESAEFNVFAAVSADDVATTERELLYRNVQELQERITSFRRERDSTALAAADSARFISGLEQKVVSLNDSSLVAEHLGDVHFASCPACFSQLDPSDRSEHACHLCKTPFDPERMKGRIVGLINETAVQLKQSKVLQERRRSRLQVLDTDLENLTAAWKQASGRMNLLDRLPSTEAQAELRSLNRAAGYLEREIEGIAEKERIAELVATLGQRKADLTSEISRLRAAIEAGRAAQARRLGTAYTAIADQIRDLLRSDLRRQDSFEDPRSIAIDFSANQLSVDGHSYFSASSRVILRSSFFLGFFAAATQNRYFRHPRFVIIDTMEDKGMEPERSHNFQNQILRKSQESKALHQAIYATAMISPELDDETFTIGRFSTRDEPTLSIG